MSETQTATIPELYLNPDVSLSASLGQAGFERLGPEERLGIIESATLDGYKQASLVIHKMVAPDTSHEAQFDAAETINPRTGQVSAVLAKPEERDGIMAHALDAAQQVAQKYRQEGGSLEDALQRCGNLAAFGIVLAHTYKDGNGRTARVVGELVHNGHDPADAEQVADLTTLATNRPQGVQTINPYRPTGVWIDGRMNQLPMEFLDTVAALDVPLDPQSYAAATFSSFTTPRMGV